MTWLDCLPIMIVVVMSGVHRRTWVALCKIRLISYRYLNIWSHSCSRIIHILIPYHSCRVLSFACVPLFTNVCAAVGILHTCQTCLWKRTTETLVRCVGSFLLTTVFVCSMCLCSRRQQPALPGDVFRLCIDAAAGPADQQLHVRAPGGSFGKRFSCFSSGWRRWCVSVLLSIRRGTSQKCDFSVQVQLRFCLSETSCPQEDHFPPNLCVKVNGKPCNLPVRAAGSVIFCSSAGGCRIFSQYSKCPVVLIKLKTISHSLSLSPMHAGLPSSNQKRRWAQATQSAHQHYLTGQIVHHSPKHHSGVVDGWDWKGKGGGGGASRRSGPRMGDFMARPSY